MATFMYFMVYNLTLTSSKIAVITWTDSTYSEWQFIMTDVGLAMIMVSPFGKVFLHSQHVSLNYGITRRNSAVYSVHLKIPKVLLSSY